MNEDEAMEDSSDLPNDLEALQTIIDEADATILSLQGSIAQEEAKMEKYKVYITYTTYSLVTMVTIR